jgi:hypothetical protein
MTKGAASRVSAEKLRDLARTGAEVRLGARGEALQL